LDCDVFNDGICSGLLVDSKNFVFIIRFYLMGKRSRKGGTIMKNAAFLIITILLVVYCSFGVTDFSEAKDKLSDYDRQILQEFNSSLKNSSEGRFQTASTDDKSILIIDTKLGHLWIFRTSPEPIIKYAGKVHPGKGFWKTVYKAK